LEVAAGDPTHVIVLRTLDAPEPLPRLRSRRGVDQAPAAWLSRATVVDVALPMTPPEAAAWLADAGEDFLRAGLATLNRALDAYRIAAADPGLGALDRRQAVVARIGYGRGEEVAEGRFTQARDLLWRPARRGRRRMLVPEARLAAILTGRERPLVAEELSLRARGDLDAGRVRHGALQTLIALDAAIAELSGDPAPEMVPRLAELRDHREPVTAAAQTALTRDPSAEDAAAVADALASLGAVLRAYAARTT
jgi:hypothetical protein